MRGGGGQSDGTQKREIDAHNGAQENKGEDDGRQQREQRGGGRARCKCA